MPATRAYYYRTLRNKSRHQRTKFFAQIRGMIQRH
jgi:hypothetical protein